MVNARIAFTWVKSVGPCPAKAFQANWNEGENAHPHVLKAIGVGKFPKK
jgi:hypothetical protein